jgi:phosphate transport system permease protein
MASITSRMPDEASFRRGLAARRARGRFGQFLFLMAILIGLLLLIILLFSIINQTFGVVAVKDSIHPEALVTDGRTLEELSAPELAGLLETNLSKGKLQALLLTRVLPSDVDRSRLGTDPIGTLLPAGLTVSEAVGAKKFADLTPDDITTVLADNLSTDILLEEVYEQVVGREVLQSWPLIISLFNPAAIQQEITNKSQGIGFAPTLTQQQVDDAKANYTAAKLEWTSWLDRRFLSASISSTASEAGIRGAIAGTLWVLMIAIVPAGLIGVGAAVYLEEYAKAGRTAQNKWLNRVNQFIEINIRNLAGVPSIIYGLLGLAVFANALSAITSGQVFGIDGANGKTVLSAGLTLGLLILPVIIINAQEAIRAVPSSIREASYGLGATRWQTVSRTVLPSAVPGIMTGIILSLSRAIGESAPLIVVGAAVFLSQDPNGPFKQFTTLPIQIFNWASQPDDQFRNASSAAIIVLLVLLLLLNATAIFVRQRFSRSLQ